MLIKIPMARCLRISPRISLADMQFFLWQILIFLMLFMPRNIQMIKIGLLGVMMSLALIQMLAHNRVRLNQPVTTIAMLFLAYAAMTFTIGYLRINPGALDFFRVNIVYFIMFILLIPGISNLQMFRQVVRTLVFTTNAISVYSIILLLVNIGLWPQSLFYAFDVDSRVGIHEGYTHLVNTNLSMMIFLAPFVTALLFRKYTDEHLSRKYLMVTEFLMLIAVLISGRRILWIVMALAVVVLLVYGSSKITIKFLKAFVVGTVVLIAVVFLMNYFSLISIDGLINRLVTVFQGEEGDIRLNQGTALFNGFLRYPIFGSGVGIGVPEVVRNANPWVYEMSYHLLLYNSGLVGFILYGSGMILILKALWVKVRGRRPNEMAFALALAFASTLISNSTNPYLLSSFDFLWFIFVPLMYINLGDKVNQPDSTLVLAR